MLLAIGFVAAAVAAVDWWAVWNNHARIERFAKPMVMIALMALALATTNADPAVARWFVLAGLGFGLVGDVLLLPVLDKFLHGLAAFLVGHLFYVAAFATMDLAGIGIVGGVAAAAVLMLYLGWPTVKAVQGTAMAAPVLAYMAVIVAMVVMGTATHRWPIAAGGVLFAISDGLLGVNRFVREMPKSRVLVHMLYHSGQFGIVLGLAWLG